MRVKRSLMLVFFAFDGDSNDKYNAILLRDGKDVVAI